MTISSLLVYAQPDLAAHVRAQLERLPGVEVHAVTPEGRLVVTLEKDDDAEMDKAFEPLASIPGVLATALVYHHSEALSPPLCGLKRNSVLARREPRERSGVVGAPRASACGGPGGARRPG